MKKIIYILLFICSFAKAQHIPRPGFNPAVEDYVAQCSTKPDLKVQVAINKFTARLIATGDWLLLDRCWLIANDIEANAKISIKNPTSSAITGVNSPTWAQYAGVKSNGTSSYYNSNFNPSANGVNFTKNSAAVGVYINDIATSAGQKEEYGCMSDANFNSSTSRLDFYANLSGTTYVGINQNQSDLLAMGYTAVNAVGLYSGIRTSSTSVTAKYNTITKNTQTSTAMNPVNFNMYISASNSAGATINYSVRVVSFLYIGSGAVSEANIYTAEEELRALIGY